MNLWIRSQDKKELRPNPKLGIDRLESNYYIVDRYSFEKEIILGKYATEERALEVLDEIQNLFLFEINDASYERADLFLKMKMLPIVYKMPKE